MLTVNIITTGTRFAVSVESGTTVRQVLQQNNIDTTMKNSVNNVPVGLDYQLTERDMSARTFTDQGSITLTVVKAITGN
jgi:NAD(P)H-dependent flavin oxidoreductase YrpB (nitropropane dioxygenase family)